MSVAWIVKNTLDCLLNEKIGLSCKKKQILVRYPVAQRWVLPEVPWRVWEPAGESEFNSRALHPCDRELENGSPVM